MPDYAAARRLMVARHIAGRGVRNRNVLAAMEEVPREAFVSADLRSVAYHDVALPIEDGQSISQPYIVAAMIDAAGVRPGARVLEVGAGSGYAAAVLSRIAERVCAIECNARLAALARERFAALGYDSIDLHLGDGANGWPEAAPFDAILVSAAGASIPEALREQLAVGGRLVMPVATADNDQRLILLKRSGPSEFAERDLGRVSFVPLTGG